MKISRAVTSKGTLLAGALLALGMPALAIPITGGFGTTASGVMTFADAGNTVHKIDYCPSNVGSPPPVGLSCNAAGALPGFGRFDAQGGSGTFASIVGLTPGTIKDMVDQNIGDPNFTYFPVGPGSDIAAFLTVSTFPTFDFRAKEFVFQSCAGTPGVQECIGGFVLTQVGTNVSVSFTVNGIIQAATYDDTPFTYIITGQFNNTTISAVSAGAQSTGGIFSNTWSGSLNANVPEPGTITMLGIGAIAILFGRLRARRDSESK